LRLRVQQRELMDNSRPLMSIRQDMNAPKVNLNGSSAQRHPLTWREWVRPSRSIASEPHVMRGAIVQRWERSSRRMNQPPLDHHYIVLHLGGDKRVTRRRGRHVVVRDIVKGSLSTIEAGSSYLWNTEGPIAFAHLYLEPGYFAQTVGENFDCDPAKVELQEVLGEFDPLLASLMTALVRAAESDDLSEMAREAQLDATLVRLYERQTRVMQAEHRLIISPSSLKRVKEYVGDHLRDPISLDDLAGLAGYSRFHFARGFRAATGLPPYAYILRARIALACNLLSDNDLPVHAIATHSGFTSHPQFASRFRQLTGISPSLFRRLMR